MSAQIITVKLHQTKLSQNPPQPFHYFPFDLCYLVPPKLVDRIPGMFPVYLSLKLTKELLGALNLVSNPEIIRGTVRRNYDNPKSGLVRNNFVKLCPDPTGWQLIVPTFKRNWFDFKKKRYTRAEIAYVGTNALTTLHNLKARLPAVELHVPERSFPLLCTACFQLPEHWAGKCTPGTAVCRTKREINLKVEPKTRASVDREKR